MGRPPCTHGRSAHPLYAQSLFAEQEYACASPIKHVVARHARSAAANPMLGISEVVGALYRHGCCSGHERVAGSQRRWSAALQARNDGVRVRAVFVSRASRALEPVDVHRGRRVTSSSMTMSSLQTSVLS